MLDKCWTKIVKYLWYKFYVIELNSFNISICRASLACCCLVWHLKNVYTYSGLNSSIIEALFLSLFMGSTPLLVLDLGMTWLEFFDSFVGHSVGRLLGRLWGWSDWSHSFPEFVYLFDMAIPEPLFIVSNQFSL